MDQLFDGYRILDEDDVPDTGTAHRPAGAATRARIRRAVRDDDGSVVAVKVFPAGARDLARREADIAGAIDHPHLLRGSPVPGRDGAVGLVFPWLTGGSLAALVAVRRRLTWPEVLTVLIPLADALAAAHERGLVHGDVAPGNVLFADDGRPMLADFGAARAAAESGMEVWATPQHVAPEIVRGATPSPAADLFSLGSVALFCLTGRPAWPAEDLQDVLIQSTAGQWPELEENMAPGALRDVVQRLLRPEPAERGSAARLAVELRRIGDPEPVALVSGPHGATSPAPGAATMVRPDAVRPPSTRLQQRHRAHRGSRPPIHVSWRGLAASAVVSALAVGAVGVGWWWGAGSPVGVPVVAPAVDPSGGHAGTVDVSVGPTDEFAQPAALSAEPSAPATGRTPASAVSDAATWQRVVVALDAARSKAFVSRDASLLDAVYLPGSPARDADAARITALNDTGVRPDGALHHVTSVRVVGSQRDGSAVLAVVEDQPPAALFDSAGTLIGRSPAVAESTVLLHLDSTDDGYRISRVEHG